MCIRDRRYSAEVELSDPSESEDVPVLLENNVFAEPVEGVLESFSMPGKMCIRDSSIHTGDICGSEGCREQFSPYLCGISFIPICDAQLPFDLRFIFFIRVQAG